MKSKYMPAFCVADGYFFIVCDVSVQVKVVVVENFPVKFDCMADQ